MQRPIAPYKFQCFFCYASWMLVIITSIAVGGPVAALLNPFKYPLVSFIIEDLHRIAVPTGFIKGRYDEAQDESVGSFFQQILKIKWIHFF